MHRTCSEHPYHLGLYLLHPALHHSHLRHLRPSAPRHSPQILLHLANRHHFHHQHCLKIHRDHARISTTSLRLNMPFCFHLFCFFLRQSLSPFSHCPHHRHHLPHHHRLHFRNRYQLLQNLFHFSLVLFW